MQRLDFLIIQTVRTSLVAKWSDTVNYDPAASKVRREVANLTERKNPHTPRVWCQRICLSVCFWQEIITLTRPIRRGV